MKSYQLEESIFRKSYTTLVRIENPVMNKFVENPNLKSKKNHKQAVAKHPVPLACLPGLWELRKDRVPQHINLIIRLAKCDFQSLNLSD